MIEKTELENFRSSLLICLLSGLVLSLVSFWTLSSYFKVDVAASLMYQADDGWCKVPTESIGVHCFGDFNERVGLADDHAWKDIPELSPIGPFVTLLANALLETTSARVTLLLFLCIFMAFAISPIFLGTRNYHPAERIKFLMILGIGTYPVLTIFDRGHSLALVSPLLFLYLRFTLKRRYELLSLIIIALACLKPVYLGLALIFLILEKPFRFIMTVIFGVLCPASFIVLSGPGGFDRLSQWLQAAAEYTTSFREINQVNPPNASVASSVYMITEALSQVLGAADLELWVLSYGHILSIALAAFISIGIIFLRRRLPIVVSALILLVVVSLFFGKYVAPYYLLFATAALGFIFSNEAVTFWPSTKYGAVKKSLFFALLATSVPLILPVIPSNWFELQQVQGPIVIRTLNVSIATFAWLAFCIIAILTELRGRGDDV